MMFALNSDNTCLISLMAAVQYHIQKGECQKAVDAYRAILTCLIV